MRIGIDARLYGPSVGGGGLGRYVEQLVKELQSTDRQNRYLLFLKPENFKVCPITNRHFEKRAVPIHWYTLKEQLFLGPTIDRAGLDLVHFPHWNVPLNLKTPFVVTIHDLILLDEPASAHATTLPFFLYWLKRLGFRLVLRRALFRAQKIIAVSAYTKQSILKHFPKLDPRRIEVIYEGVTDLSPSSSSPSSSLVASPYFLYVGNAYPHKNLISLLHAFSFFHQLHPEVQLVLAGRKDVFYRRLSKELSEIGVAKDKVKFIMNPTDRELSDLYRHATLYLFPSKAEGFGLPPLEAMRAGLPVAAARASSLPEILGDAAVYFSPDDIEGMVAIMEDILRDAAWRADLIKKGKERVKKYSWLAMAAATRRVYAAVHPS